MSVTRETVGTRAALLAEIERNADSAIDADTAIYTARRLRAIAVPVGTILRLRIHTTPNRFEFAIDPVDPALFATTTTHNPLDK